MSSEFVILLHGLARRKASMWPMAKYLKAAGYQIVNLGYPSTKKSITQIVVEDLSPVVDAIRFQAKKIHFVTHSMGGILVREYLQQHQLPEGSRVVMLAPPNHGSELVNRLKRLFFYKKIMGHSGLQLSTDQISVPNCLKPIPYEVGIIAGDKSLEPWLSWMIPGANDGKVSVKSTYLEEMRDHLVVHHGHSFIMWAPDVMAQVLYFLHQGVFKHEG